MLSVEGISKEFPGLARPVLSDLCFSAQAGDFCVVLGSNGSGKSTFFRCLSGQYPIDKGRILWDHQDSTPTQRCLMTACVSQETHKSTILEMTLLENMVLARLRGQSASFRYYRRLEQQLRAEVATWGLGLESYIDQPLSVLSGGQRQMVAVFMAFMVPPPLLLLDEHSSALDPSMQKKMMEYTAKKVAEYPKMITLMITHHLDDALLYGNRLIMLHAGQIVFSVSGLEKKNLQREQLLDLFHQYEDLLLGVRS